MRPKRHMRLKIGWGGECVEKADAELLFKENREAIERAIADTLPERTGQRNKRIFGLCRHLKAIPDLAELPASVLKPIVREWHGRCVHVIGTKDFDSSWDAFTYGYERVKHPAGVGTLGLAVERTEKAEPLSVESEYDSESTWKLIRLCRELQKLRGKEPFYLSCRDAGEFIGLSHDKANRRLNMLVTDGVLSLTEKGTKRMANSYRFIG